MPDHLTLNRNFEEAALSVALLTGLFRGFHHVFFQLAQYLLAGFTHTTVLRNRCRINRLLYVSFFPVLGISLLKLPSVFLSWFEDAGS
jgi:hypothetical protein